MNTITTRAAAKVYGATSDRIILSITGHWSIITSDDHGIDLAMHDPVGLVEAIVDALTPEQRAGLVEYMAVSA